MRVEIEHTNLGTGEKVGIVAMFNERELAVRIFEELTSQPRPEGMTWEQGWEEITARWPEQAEAVLDLARVAMRYFSEQVSKAGRQPADRTQ